MILHGLDTNILDKDDKRTLDRFCDRYNDSMSIPLPREFAPYFDEAAFEQNLEAT